ncbi:hypothetical protein [Stagnihabitans tardus]|uniref:Uncharacterized protein n=1 Tax=Stagnihabitans tardus TaxID=2699202 RepID=A0AAE5BSM1_9RHOB|nr:hypothetical protein [Stagnihabitans tardus]NBZ88025.1 hypothetical protein [Stagnihabitans tardus]
MFRRVSALLPFALIATVAAAADFKAAEEAYLNASIRPWAENAALVDAIKAANAERAAFDQAKIDELDAAWKAEVGTSDTPTITPVLTNAASDFLRAQVEASGGAVTEAFVTDAKGLNVAVSEPTSDMWQGDEPKFSEVFPKGKDGVLFSDVELDESTQIYSGQISISITDPATGEVIGTLTVGVNAESLM